MGYYFVDSMYLQLDLSYEINFLSPEWYLIISLCDSEL